MVDLGSGLYLSVFYQRWRSFITVLVGGLVGVGKQGLGDQSGPFEIETTPPFIASLNGRA